MAILLADLILSLVISLSEIKRYEKGKKELHKTKTYGLRIFKGYYFPTNLLL
jgi:NADH:ubiquinone oxidoreductase subunit 6 (subunit J)